MKKRCAIYTRKSHEEGLDQEFNSLHAQREACEAFVKSQKHEGWQLVKTHFDDGGVSGGTIDRPALKTLMETIEAGKIDIVVVYKVDRLTRSLADFAKLVELFDEHEVSFVSVTQQFNTTTSMGRLTLNVLLSFAQFEREVTSERIRDKIAASKKKGMWMGGVVPLGFDNVDRKLVVNVEEATRVRKIFETYLEYGSVLDARDRLLEVGVSGKEKPNGSRDKRARGALSRGAIYTILRNPLYCGKIHHAGELFEGLHEAIVDETTWQKAQELLNQSKNRQGTGERKSEQSPLSGKLFDSQGGRFTPSHATKNGRRYHYYISANNKSKALQRVRVPAAELEACIFAGLRNHLQSVADYLRTLKLSVASHAAHSERTEKLSSADETFIDSAGQLIERAEISDSELRVELSRGATAEFLLGDESDLDDAINEDQTRLTIPFQLKRGPRSKCVIISPVANTTNTPDPTLVKALARANHWWQQIKSGAVGTFKEIAEREGLNSGSYVERLLRLAFLPHELKQQILDGTQPSDLTLEELVRAG